MSDCELSPSSDLALKDNLRQSLPGTSMSRYDRSCQSIIGENRTLVDWLNSMRNNYDSVSAFSYSSFESSYRA
jgi:hypothetical protein